MTRGQVAPVMKLNRLLEVQAISQEQFQVDNPTKASDKALMRSARSFQTQGHLLMGSSYKDPNRTLGPIRILCPEPTSGRYTT